MPPAAAQPVGVPSAFDRGLEMVAVVGERVDAGQFPRDETGQINWDETDSIEWRLVVTGVTDAPERSMATNKERVIAALERWFANPKNELMPSGRDLMRLADMTSVQAVQTTLSELRRDGRISGIGRGARLVEKGAAEAIASERPASLPPAGASPRPTGSTGPTGPVGATQSPPRSDDIESILEQRAEYHEREAELRTHHETEARKLRAALAAMRDAS